MQFEASTPERLIEQYHPFTRAVPNASFRGAPLKFTPWPLVRLVRIFLYSPILQQNVAIADVPGDSDTNYFRVENAARYLQECDMTIVVGKIDRLQDNNSFQSQYMEAYRRKRSGSVILVATRSDGRSIGTAQTLARTNFLEKDLNIDGKSTLVLDPVTEETVEAIAHKVTDIERQIFMTGNEMERNNI